MPWDNAGDDIVADILQRVVALTPGFSAALAVQIDRDVRDLWGGDRPYIARRAGEGSSQRNAAIRRDWRAGERIGYLVRKYGLTRQRIHQIVALPEEPEPAPPPAATVKLSGAEGGRLCES
jgi:Mor family transcriptional regulator